VQVLKGLPHFPHPWQGDEAGPLDDAAVLHTGSPGRSLVYTLDVITPLVDDPRAFGRIAAANALSDVYAMGGTPEVALSFAGMPESLGLDVLREVLAGLAEKTREARCGIVGGHTIKDSEPKCGLAVIGSVDSAIAWTHRRARAGQLLVLTKSIGTGVVGQALRKGAAPDDAVAAAVHSMERLNDEAMAAGLRHDATAATDVTGFGLLGHLWHLANASDVEVQLWPDAVPLLPQVHALAAAGHVPGGSRRNLAYVAPHLSGRDLVDDAQLLLLADAQTSGGLVLCVDENHAEAVVSDLDGAAIIGALFPHTGGHLQLRPRP
jgi:selenide,water dikinase